MTRAVEVALPTRHYQVRIGQGLLGPGAHWQAALGGRHVLLLTDDRVGPLYAARVAAALAGRQVAVHTVPHGEQHKTLAEAGRAFAALAALGASRDASVVALGGGVVGDLGGFVAACWMRGVDYVQVPTTLLAMVDSSVGGKTAVDLPEGKNLVGAFHQPRAVLADTATLATLPERELRAGCAEVVKYGAIIDAAFVDWLEAHAAALLARDPDALATAIERSVAHKAAIVVRDEHERGERALLNFGHTFAHAFETATGYERLRHGEAVAIGMVCAARLAARLGLADAAEVARLRGVLQRFGLPTEPPAGLDTEQLLGLMRLDKKARSGRLRFVLWRGIGRAELVDDVPDAAVRTILDGSA